jgi:[ribosomal protein S18]-alanine N-acetyltransferase
MVHIIELGPDNFEAYAGGIIEIERASFLSPWGRNAFKAEAEKDISFLWVLSSDGITAGYICFWIIAEEVQLMNLAIRPEMRGKGLGQGLLEGMIDKGIENGAGVVWLEVRPSNLAARGLYKRMGFHEKGIRPRYYPETNEDAIIMSLDLFTASPRPIGRRINS